jgi:predicted phosphodiesterase
LRYLILSDMHGNYDALRVVLRHVRRRRFAAILVLGDLVGYGAAPNQVVETLRRLPGRTLFVRGNHDKVACGIDDGASFNHAALTAAQWTEKKLTPANLRFVRELPQGPLVLSPRLMICHGAPHDEDCYVFSESDAWDGFRHSSAPVVFFGHTHLPSVFVLHAEGVSGMLLRGSEGSFQIVNGHRYLINPGSIGQPRDRDPRASFMTYDEERGIVQWHRLSYPVPKAQDRIVKAGLPRVLAERLAYGL